MVLCKKCGAENQNSALYCQECGEKLIIKNNNTSKNFLSRFNWTAIFIGFLVGLFFTIIFEFSIGYFGLFLAPIITGFISVFLANNLDLRDTILTGFFSILPIGLVAMIVPPLGIAILILGGIGGLLGLILNKKFINKETRSDNLSRVKSIEEWIKSLKGARKGIVLIGTIFIGLLLIIGVFAIPGMKSAPPATTVSTPTPNITNNNTTQTTTPPAPTSTNTNQNLENNVKSGVEDFFREFNTMYNEDGVNTGYIINTIQIDKLNKISDTEVEVTVSLKRIASNGDNFDSKWSGPLYLKDGKWVDNGNFVQTYSYNKNTGEKTI